MSFWPLLTPEQWAGDAKEWLPNDPLYTREQWQKIKDIFISANARVPFSRIVDMLGVAAGTYQAAIICERPKKLEEVGHNFKSDRNRRKLDEKIKIFQNLEKILAAESTSDRRTQKACMKKALAFLSNNQYRRCIHDDNNQVVNVEIARLIEWLEQNPALPSAPIHDFDAAISRVLRVLGVNGNYASQPGPSVKHARYVFIQRLDYIWCAVTRAEPASYRDDGTEKYVSRFGNFVAAALIPISSQWDGIDTGALESAVWVYVNKKRGAAKT